LTSATEESRLVGGPGENLRMIAGLQKPQEKISHG